MEKYLKFEGRATRSEYWGVMLVSWGIAMAAALLSIGFVAMGQFGTVMGIIMLMILLVLTSWAGIATAVRRCRDAGINPWFAASLFVPYVNFVTTIVFGVLESKGE